MKVFNIFSKRQKMLRGETPEVYTYDVLPRPLRVQIVYIWKDSLVGRYKHESEKGYETVVKSLRREYGVFELTDTTRKYRIFESELQNFLLYENNVEKALDAIELSFQYIERYWNKNGYPRKANVAIKELNYRFKYHGIGYQFTSGEIIRVDSEYIHAEIVKPGLMLLNEPHYAGAQQEFLNAHKHYRKGNAKEALNECLKAFESTMKAICDKRGWSYNKTATANTLIQVCFKNELIPRFWQNHYSSLKKLLVSSVPPGRNELSAHGQGSDPVTVQNHIVAYMLHMTASAIVFLAESDKNLS